MYYCLNEEYLMRGWEKIGTAFVRRMSDQVVFVDPNLYMKIKDMGWMVFEGSPFLSEMEREALARLKEAGIMDLCDSIRPLEKSQEYRLYPNRFIKGVQWAMTGKCNCRCLHCYMSAPSGNVPEYTTEECLDIIDQMEDAGVQIVNLTGGEALVRKDFFLLAERLTKAGIRIDTIMSNGLLVSEQVLTGLEELGQKPEFNMSFDGIGCHDRLRGREGVEKAVINAFRLCRGHGFQTGAEYCLHKGNMQAFRDSVKLLADLGCGSLKVNSISDEGEARNLEGYFLTFDEEYQFYLDYIPQFFEDGCPIRLMLSSLFRYDGEGGCSIPAEKMPEDQDCGSYCLCGHARNWMHITADGYIVPCIPIGSVECGRKHFPNIHDISIAEALHDSNYMSFIDTRLNAYFEHNPGCAKCKYRNRCAGGCRGHAAVDGDLLGTDRNICAVFKDGWYDKVKRIIPA